MREEHKTKEQLMSDLAELRQRIAELEVSEAERKQAEEELRSVHRKLRATFDAIQDLVNVVDLDFNLTDVNGALLNAFGLPDRESVLGRKCFEALKGRQDLCPNCAVGEAYRTKAPAYRTTTPEDEASTGGRSFEIFAYPITDEQGNLSGAVEFARDITERKQAGEALRESEERYRSLFESTREGIIISGPDGRISSVNPATVAILGYKNREEVVGRPAVEFYADPEERKAVFEELMEKGYVTDVELAVEKRDSTQAYASASFAIHKDREGNLLRAEAVFRDITDRKRAEGALRESEERLSSFMESATDGFVLYDSELNLVEINKAALEVFPPGIKREDVIRKNMLDISPGLKETGRYDQYV